MAEAKTGPMQIVQNGTVGGPLAYLICTWPTEWLGYLPPIPEPHYVTSVAALAGVLSVLIQPLRKKLEGK